MTMLVEPTPPWEPTPPYRRARWWAGVASAAVVLMAVGCQRRPPAAGGPAPGCHGRAESGASRQAARRRARQSIHLVDYPPATLGGQPAVAVASYPETSPADATAAAGGSAAPVDGQSFVYDNALALLWFGWTGQRRRAVGLAETLIFLQRPDGSWGFRFRLDGRPSAAGGYVRSGAVGWAAAALGYVGTHLGMPRAVGAARRAGRWLAGMRLVSGGMADGLISAGTGRPGSPARPRQLDFAVAEHQFDAHAVLARWAPQTARRLSGRIMKLLWLDRQGRFAVAAGPRAQRTGRALDAAGAWGALWLESTGEQTRARRSLAYTLAEFRAETANLYGFRPYEDSIDGYEPAAAADHIFVEGTMGVGLAAHRLGDAATAQAVVDTGVALSCMGPPGLAYSTVAMPGFSTRPSAASTLWFLFLDRELATGRRAPIFDRPGPARPGYRHARRR